MKFFTLLIAFMLSVSAADLVILNHAERSELEIHFRNKPILLYAYATNQFKPYVKSLYTLSGQNVLRDAPADHLHHHGLMYAIRINGINFWEEVGDPGHELASKILSQSRSTNAAGLPQASFTQLIHWVSHANSKTSDPYARALLTETRTITVTINEPRDEVAVDWKADFRVGAAPAKLTGSFYNGLGLRLPQSFDNVSYHQNSEDLPYSVEQERDVTAAHWSAVTGITENKAATIALFETPTNKGETRFYTMLKPFAYLSVTQNLDQKPLEYRAHDKFTIRYLLTLSTGSRDAAFLNARYLEWLRACK
jgi:hypothetical protein